MIDSLMPCQRLMDQVRGRPTRLGRRGCQSWGGINLRLYRFDEQTAMEIRAFNSVNLRMSRIAETASPSHIGCMHIGPNGTVGFHQATCAQLFVVVQGEGWVGTEEHKIPICFGEAAFWEAGEWHESGSDTGMTVIVLESDDLDPSRMPELIK